MRTGTKTVLYLLVLAFFDTVIPVPITVGILLFVVLERPPWFKRLVTELYTQ